MAHLCNLRGVWGRSRRTSFPLLRADVTRRCFLSLCGALPFLSLSFGVRRGISESGSSPGISGTRPSTLGLRAPCCRMNFKCPRSACWTKMEIGYVGRAVKSNLTFNGSMWKFLYSVNLSRQRTGERFVSVFENLLCNFFQCPSLR